MINEGKGCKIIPLSGITASMPSEGVGIGLLDKSILEQQMDYWTNTGFTLGLMYKLFNTEQRLGKILGQPHKDRTPPNDLLELWDPILINYIGLYCFSNGGVTFALCDEYSITSGKRGGYPKVPSTGSKLGDAQLIAKSLSNFAFHVESNVQIDGPTEEEPYVVMTRPQVTSIGDCGENEEILGVVFSPTASKKHSTVHGKMQLLVREKPQI